MSESNLKASCLPLIEGHFSWEKYLRSLHSLSSAENGLSSSNVLKKSQLSPGHTRPLSQSSGSPGPLQHLCSAGSERFLSVTHSLRPGGQDPNLWTVENVMKFIRDLDPQLSPHADLFHKHVRNKHSTCNS